MTAAVVDAPMTRKVIRVDGREEPLDGPTSMRLCEQLIGANGIDVVQLRHLGLPRWVMLVDDTGLVDGREVNVKATRLYHENCRPGTVHPICGDVAIVLDDDYAGAPL